MRGLLLALPLLVAACSGRMQPAGLAGTGWELVQLREGGRALRVEDPSRYTMAFEAGEQVALRLDCNRVGAPAIVTPLLTGGRIEIGPIATTRAACPPGSLDTRVAQGLTQAQRYRLDGDTMRIEQRDGGQQIWRRAAVTPPA